FTVSMALTPARFLVAVTDGSRRVPTLRAPGTSVISSQGMQLVGALSQDWGVRLVHGSGKTVWATFDRRRVWTS
ncbi:MAG TPA: ATP-binding protein, partial [Kineosporiaceae bacterium]|nr:ATP-binding protein [Kineosporiaceae bacterium]